MKLKLNIDSQGSRVYRLPNGRKHREDGPAVLTYDGVEFWFLNGKLHRKGNPAIIAPYNGNREWWLRYKRHRKKLSSYENNYAHKEWWINGKLHREDGPAIEYYNENFDMHWYLDGEEYTEQEYKKKIRLIKIDKIL